MTLDRVEYVSSRTAALTAVIHDRMSMSYRTEFSIGIIFDVATGTLYLPHTPACHDTLFKR